MKKTTVTIVYLGLLFFCIGCNSPTPTASDSGLESRSLSELVKMAMTESDEIKFCLDDQAGIESLQEPGERLQKVVQALPESVAASGLPSAKQDKANKSIEALTKAYDGLASALDSQASPKEIFKANSKIHSEIITLTKLSR